LNLASHLTPALPPRSLRPARNFSIAFLLGAALLTGCGQGGDSAKQQARAQEYVERADNYRRQGQFRAAIIEARNALQQNPQDRAAMRGLAEIFNEVGQGKSATQVMQPLVNDASRDEALVLLRGWLLQRKFQSALDYYAANEARLNLANDSAARLLKARALLGLVQTAEAESILNTLDPNDTAVQLEKARLLRLQGRSEDSRALLAASLQKSPEDVTVLAEAARTAEQDGDLAAAEDHLSKALINLPTTDIMTSQKADVLQRMVTILTKLGRSNEALIYAKTLAEANPQGAELQDKFKQGVELFQAGKLDEAEKVLTDVYVESDNETVGSLLGMIRYAKNDLQGAANYLSNNVDPELAPDEALTTLAATQLRLSQPDKLLALFDTAARARLKNPELKTLVGIALLQTGGQREGEALIAAALKESPDNPGIRATLARYHLASRQPDRAIALLQEGLKARADEALSQLLINAYAVNGQTEQALATAQQLTKTSPDKAESWWTLGRTALQLQKPEIADDALRNALGKQPDFLPAQLDQARLYLLRRQGDQAATAYRAILKQHPDHVPALKGLLLALAQQGAEGNTLESQYLDTARGANAKAVLAEYYLRQQRTDDAERQLADISPTETAAYPRQLRLQSILMRVTQAMQAKDYDKARDAIGAGLALDPQSLDLQAVLARVDLQAGDMASAKKIAAQLPADSLQSMELLGDIAALERSAAAADHYRAAWKKHANDIIAVKLYQTLAQDPAAGNAFLGEWLQKLPGSANAYFLRGVKKQQAGDRSGAMADYEAAIARNPQDARALNNLAWLQFEAGDSRALVTAEKAYALQPESPAIVDTYGWILVKSGNKPKGIEMLKKALALAPGSKDIEQHLNDAGK
jgi:tetratricopeptide (TPR) repeat protein